MRVLSQAHKPITCVHITQIYEPGVYSTTLAQPHINFHPA